MPVHIHSTFKPDPDPHKLGTIEVDIFGATAPHREILQTLRDTGGSYSPEVTWDRDRRCFHLTAQWNPDPNWGDTIKHIARRLARLVGDMNTSVEITFLDVTFQEGTLIEALTE